MHYGTVESPESLETSVPFNDSVTSLVNFSTDFTSFSMPLKVPSSSEELTKKKHTHTNKIRKVQKSPKGCKSYWVLATHMALLKLIRESCERCN